MSDRPGDDRAEELERLAREGIVALLRRARTASERRLLRAALDDPANRAAYLERYHHRARHSQADGDECGTG